MSDRDGLLAAILAEPGDDTPRLVYADWLDEHDEPDRAEFIRVQCRLPHPSPRTAEAKRLAARERELRAKLFTHLDNAPFTNITFRRGFVDSVTSGLHAFVENATQLRPEDAPAYELVLDPGEEDEEALYHDENKEIRLMQSIAERPELRRCISLDPQLYLTGYPAALLFRSPYLNGLRRLRATGDADDAFEDLDSPTFANLRWLNLHDNDDMDHHPPTITRLVHSAHLAHLEHLDLGSCNLDGDCLLALATTPHLQQLRFLDISGGYVSEAFAEFCRTEGLPSLVELDLSASLCSGYGGYNPLESLECVQLLADSPLLERLTSLALRQNQITDEGARILAASPRKVQLTKLDLCWNTISEETKLVLEKRFGKGVCVYEEPTRPSD